MAAQDDHLADIFRRELATFRQALIVDVEKVIARTLPPNGTMGMQYYPMAYSEAENGGNADCQEPFFRSTSPRHRENGHTEEGDPDVDVLEEADDEAREFVEELEAQCNDGAMLKMMQDDSFASTFMANVTAEEDLQKPHYHVEALYATEGIWQAMARSSRFKNTILLLVFANAIYVGVELDMKGNHQLYDAAWEFIIAENLFCFVFIFEITIRFLAFARKRDCLRDGWFRFDATLAFLAVMEIWVIVPAMMKHATVNFPMAPIRVLRCLKMTRMTRVLRSIPELMIMSKGMFLASRAVLSSMLMILFLNYGFAVILQLLISGDTEVNEALYNELKRDFSSIPACMWTLFMDATQMAAGDVVLTELMATRRFEHILGSVLIISYMLLSSLVIMNMLIGCLCEVVSSVGIHHKEEAARAMMKQSILVDLQKFDNGDGMLNRKELHTALKSEQSKQVLRSLQIDELFLKELQSMLFPHPDSQVSIKAVMQLMLSCRGDLDVTVLHLARGQAFLSTLIASFEKKVLDAMDDLRVPCFAAPYPPPNLGVAVPNGNINPVAREPLSPRSGGSNGAGHARSNGAALNGAGHARRADPGNEAFSL